MRESTLSLDLLLTEEDRLRYSGFDLSFPEMVPSSSLGMTDGEWGLGSGGWGAGL